VNEFESATQEAQKSGAKGERRGESRPRPHAPNRRGRAGAVCLCGGEHQRADLRRGRVGKEKGARGLGEQLIPVFGEAVER
jgi:hypothetical protein